MESSISFKLLSTDQHCHSQHCLHASFSPELSLQFFSVFFTIMVFNLKPFYRIPFDSFFSPLMSLLRHNQVLLHLPNTATQPIWRKMFSGHGGHEYHALSSILNPRYLYKKKLFSPPSSSSIHHSPGRFQISPSSHLLHPLSLSLDFQVVLSLFLLQCDFAVCLTCTYTHDHHTQWMKNLPLDLPSLESIKTW